MLVEQLRRAVEASPRVELAKVSSLLWRAYAAGQVTEAEAQALSDLIEAKRAIPAPQRALQRRLGSRPRKAPRLTRTAPALGRIRPPAARPRRPLHAGRDRCARRDRSRGPQT